jgi:hypothetical protein
VVGSGDGGAVVGSVVGSGDGSAVAGSLVPGSLGPGSLGGGVVDELVDELSDDGSLLAGACDSVGDDVEVVAGTTGGAPPRIATISSLNASSWVEISASE